MADRTGQQLGHYRLVRLLGHGGFAEVYLGEHLRLKTQAAIKVLYTALDEDDIEGFLREAQIVARLKHPHIVRVFDFDVQDHTPFLVMDYLPHGNVRRSYPKGTALPLETIVSYVKQVASALQYAHDQKLIHRDIKPDNMMLDQDNSIVLTDFGIALMAQSSRYGSTQEVAGTAAYMAPEQFQGHPHRASDQYSLGIVVYEWLSGDRPFHGTFSEIASQHMFVPPLPLKEKVPDISSAVQQVVLTALAKDPKQRFSSVLAFSTALEQASQVIQPKPVVPVSKTIGTNQSQQPTKLATTVPVMPMSQQTVSEVSADLANPADQPRKFIPSSAKDSLPLAEKGRRHAEGESTHQKQVQADNIGENQVRKGKEAKAAQKAEKEKLYKVEVTKIPTDKQESTPTHLPPAAVPKIPKGLRSWKAPTLLLVLALLILGSGVGLYATVSLSSERVQATATATSQANSTVTATATSQANSTATAQAQAYMTMTAQASIPRKIWHIEPAGTSGYLNGVAWSGSQFVAVGAGGTILTSSNGHTWASQQSGTSADLNGVAWLGSQFVAVGGSGTILNSPNGRSWTTQHSDNPQDYYHAEDFFGVAWSGSQFVAVGHDLGYNAGTVFTSSDGGTWTAQRPGTSGDYYGVVWSGSQFVVVGAGGTILTSSDGHTWASQQSGTSGDLNGVAWLGSQFVAVGAGGTILISPDGGTWTTQQSGTILDLNGVAWSGSQFVAVGTAGMILTSRDGHTWAAQQSGTSAGLSGVTWSGSQFVAVGNNGTVLTSP